MKSTGYKLALLSAIVMLLLPWLTVTFVQGPGGLAAVLLLFFAVNPVYAAIVGVMAGKNIRSMWIQPVLCALFFVMGGWLVFDMGEPAFVLYSGVYLALGLCSMGVSAFVRSRKNSPKHEKEPVPARKKQIIVIVLICAVLLCGAIGWNVMNDYSRVLEANWGFHLPAYARCKEIYAKDSGASFHGDGIRYHVFSYKYEDFIDTMFVWTGNDHATIYSGSLSQAAQAWLDEIQVPEEWRPDYGNCLYRYLSQEDNSEIVVFWNAEENRLYILESFL